MVGSIKVTRNRVRHNCIDIDGMCDHVILAVIATSIPEPAGRGKSSALKA